jgi:hypothetical protein
MRRPGALLLPLALMLAIPLFVAGCLHWLPEEELDDDDATEADDDDATAADDDDATVDDDDATVDDDDATEPIDPLVGHGIGFLTLVDQLDVAFPMAILGAMFTGELVEPSIEEALSEEVFGNTWAFFAGPDGPRLVEPGDNYPISPLQLDGPVLALAADEGVELPWTGAGYAIDPDEGFWLPALIEGEAWQLEVNDDGPFGGAWGAPVIPPASKPWFMRQVGDRVFVPAGQGLEGGADQPGSGLLTESEVVMIRGNETGYSMAAAILDDGVLSLPGDQIPDVLRGDGEGRLAWYRANRETVELDDRLLMMVSARWAEFQVHFLPSNIDYAWVEGPPLPLYTDLEFVVRAEEPLWPVGEAVGVQLDGVSGGPVAVESPDELVVTWTDVFREVRTVDLTVLWPGGQAAGAVETRAVSLPCALTESEPNNAPSQAHFFAPGLVACGTLSSGDDVDYYRFNASAYQLYTFDTLAGRLGYPTDTILRVLDMSGQELAMNDDGFGGAIRDSRLDWTAPTNGQFLVEITPYNGMAGADHDYQLITGP